MSFRRLSSLLCAFILTAVASAQGPARVVKPSEMPGFSILQFGAFKYGESKIPENVVRSFSVQFYNGTPEEVQSVDLRFWVDVEGKTVYEKKAINIANFYDYPLANWGGALPRHIAYPEALVIDYPSEFWNTRSHDHLEIVAIHVAPDRADLHDIGHLYAWLLRSKESDVLDKLKQDPSIVTARNKMGETALMVAFATTTLPVIEAMIAAGASYLPVNRIGQSDISMLHVAAANEHLEAMGYALDHGVPVDAQDLGHQTPLDSALYTAHLPNAQWLLAHGANPNHLDIAENPPLFYALPLEDAGGIDMLVKAGADLRYHTTKGYGAMQMACSKSYARIPLVEKLVRLGLSVDDVDPKVGLTSLMVAASGQCNEVARWLIAHGADIKARDAKGQSVFDYAKTSNTLHTDRFFREQVIDKLPRTPKSGPRPTLKPSKPPRKSKPEALGA